MDETERSKQIQEHLEAIRDLQAQQTKGDTSSWPPQGFYWMFHIVAGATLGLFGAAASLLVNIIGATLTGLPAFKLIQVYLTFPMGERALALSSEQDGGVVLFVGSLLYLITGSLYGIAFHLVMRLYFPKSGFGKKLAIGSGIGLALWIINFYLILSWLQPVLLGGNWIVSMIPIWVGAGTHLVFAWTMVLVESWGRFEPRTAASGAAA